MHRPRLLRCRMLARAASSPPCCRVCNRNHRLARNLRRIVVVAQEPHLSYAQSPPQDAARIPGLLKRVPARRDNGGVDQRRAPFRDRDSRSLYHPRAKGIMRRKGNGGGGLIDEKVHCRDDGIWVGLDAVPKWLGASGEC